MASFIQLLVSGLATGAIYALDRGRIHAALADIADDQFCPGRIRHAAGILRARRHECGRAILAGRAYRDRTLDCDPGNSFQAHRRRSRCSITACCRLVISTIALSLFLKESAKDFYSSQAQPFPALVPPTDIHIFDAVVSTQSLVGAGGGHPHGGGADILLLNKTRIGRQMQATAQNPTLARILGIPVQRMVLYTFLLNAVLVAIASILISPIYLAKFTNGETLGMAAFIAAIIGGFNQVRGAILGGIILGVLDNLSAAYISSQYRGAFPLIILIAVILLRPQGLLGRSRSARYERASAPWSSRSPLLWPSPRRFS